MSSTIQCLSNTPVLINYLIDKKYLHDINRCVSVYLFMFQSMHAFSEVFTVVLFCFRESKFGTHGELAEEFAELVSQLWLNQYRSIVPRDFKVGHVQVTFKCRCCCTVHVVKLHGDVMLVVLSGKTS